MIQEKSGREFLKSVLNCDCHCLVNSICSGLAGGVVHRVKLARVTERGNLEEPHRPMQYSIEIQVLPAPTIEPI